MPADFEVEKPTTNAGAQAPTNVDSETVANDQPGGPEPSPAGGMFGNNVWDTDDSPAAADAADSALHPEQSAKPRPEPEPQRETKPEPEPAQPEGPTLEDLRAEKAATDERVANLEKRLADTQQWGNQQSMVNAAAEAVWRAQQHQRQLEEQISKQREAQKFPGVNGEEALSDPERFSAALEQVGTWSRDTTLGQVTPHIAQLNAQVQQILQATPLIEDYARMKAREKLTTQGLENDQADKLLDQALDRINQQDQAASYRINPQALVYAANLVMQETGAPIKAKPKPAPSAGTGDRKPTTKRSPLTSSQEEQLKRVEKLLPVKFDDNDRAMLARG